VRLFDLPAIEQGKQGDTARYQALGISAEMLLVSRLLELDHKLAIPVTDDDGIDVIVNYRTTVQVKSSGKRTDSGCLQVSLQTTRAAERHRSHGQLRPHVDVLAVYARDTRSWWFIPRAEVKARGNLLIREHGTTHYAQWHEAWHVFTPEGGGS
jgi:hypothetical protein